MTKGNAFPPGRVVILATHEYLPFRGGAAVYVHETAHAAIGLGFPLQVWTAARHEKGTNIVAGKCSHFPSESVASSPVVRFASSGRLTPGGLWALARGWWRRRRTLRGNPVVLMSVGAQMIFFWFDLLGIVPARGTFVVFYGSELLRFARGSVWCWLARRFYARAGGFGACSRHTAAMARESGLLPAGAEVVAAPCALPAAFLARPAPDSADAPDDGTWRVLTVARLHPRKGQREVARALALLPEAVRARVVYQTVGVGEASYREEIEAACRAGGVRCEFLNGVDDAALAGIYARCTLYAQASQTLARSVEGFGISFLEAGFHGKPSAAFLSGGVAEAVIDGRTGLLAPEGDLPALAAAIGRLLGDAGLRARMGAAGREHALSLRWEDAARALFDPAVRLPVSRETP